MENELLTTRGKIPSVTASFRVPLTVYPELLKFCRRQGETLSSLTAKLWERELGKEGETTNGKN